MKQSICILLFISVCLVACNNVKGHRTHSDSIEESKAKGVYISSDYVLAKQDVPDSFGIKINEIFLEKGHGHGGIWNKNKALPTWSGGTKDYPFQLILTIDTGILPYGELYWRITEIGIWEQQLAAYRQRIPEEDSIIYTVCTRDRNYTDTNKWDSVGQIILTKRK